MADQKLEELAKAHAAAVKMVREAREAKRAATEREENAMAMETLTRERLLAYVRGDMETLAKWGG